MTTESFQLAKPSQRDFHPANDALSERVVMVTGASGGLGQVLARACAAAGATVVLLARELAPLEALYDELDAAYATQPAILPLNLENATEHDCRQVANTLQNEFGRIDALVHTAAELGVLSPQPNIDQATWTRTMNVNLNSARLLTAVCQPLLLESELASVVFTLDRKTRAYWGGYGISKAALAALCTMLADETDTLPGADGHPRLAFNGIDPGPMRTRLRRRAFPGELESESEPPDTRLGLFLHFITRHDRSLTGQLLAWKSPGQHP